MQSFSQASAVGVLHGEDRLILGPPPCQAVVAGGHAFVAGPQFVAALSRVAAVERPELAVALFEDARRLDVVGLVEERADDAAAVVELALLAEAHRQPGVLPVDQVVALGDERVVALAVEGDEAHVPPVGLAGQLVDAGHIGVLEFLVSGDVRLGRDDGVG